MAKFDGVIFDWAGTTVDYGCFAPVQAFADSFAEFGVIPTMDEVRAPMGMLKREHVRTMLQMERISGLWKQVHGRSDGSCRVSGCVRGGSGDSEKQFWRKEKGSDREYCAGNQYDSRNGHRYCIFIRLFRNTASKYLLFDCNL